MDELLGSKETSKPKVSFKDKLKGYIDLTRAHFAPVWPLLFCTGAMLAFRNYGGFTWWNIIHVALIGLFGFEAGMVLNDILDRNVDNVEPDNTMTNYWRPFKKRPLPSGVVSLTEAIVIFSIFLVAAITLIAFLPFPNSLYVYGIMIYAYLVESFYNIKKRDQNFPFAQLLGRTDLTFFPVAGYLCFGGFDLNILYIVIFLYPWALAHLATNDIIDVENDIVKDLKTVTVLYGKKGSLIWISLFTLLHIAALPIFLLFGNLNYFALGGFILATAILITANIILILKNRSQKPNLIPLPMFHASLFIYTTSIIVDSALIL